MTPRRAVVRVAATVAMCLATTAAPPARAAAHVEWELVEAAVAVGADDFSNPRVATLASAFRFRSGDPASDRLVVCVRHFVRPDWDTGCATLPDRSVIDGALDGATIRVRVPSEHRRGGWIETHLTFVADGEPLHSGWPTGGPTFTRVLGVAVPAGAWGHALVHAGRYATVTGTTRTDRGRLPLTYRGWVLRGVTAGALVS